MRVKLLTVAAAIVLTQVLSGCFVLREIDWNKDEVDPGDVTKARISSTPVGSDVATRGNGNQAGRFFIAFDGESGNDILFKKAFFDTNGVYGSQPKPMVRDTALADQLSNSGCPFSSGGVNRGTTDPPGTEFPVVFRTRGNRQSALADGFVDSKVQVRARPEATGGFFGVAYTGEWIDNGDGEPNSNDDEIRCTGFATTSFAVAGAAPSAEFKQRVRERVQE